MSTATVDVPITALRASIAQRDLLGALRHAERAIDSRGHLPILRGVMLAGGAGQLHVTGYDYHRAAVASILAPGATGTAVVHAQRLRQMIAALPKDADVVLTTVAERLHITGGTISYSLPLLPLDQFPVIPDSGRQKFLTVTGKQLTELGWVLRAAGRDDTLPVLTGVSLQRNDTGTLTAACTDRYRLAVLDTTIKVADKALPARGILVPARAVQDAVTAFGKAAKVTITIGNKSSKVLGGADQMIWFSDGASSLATTMLDGEFPKYRSLLPDLNDSVVMLTVPAGSMHTAVKRASIAAARTAPVHLHLLGTGNVKITAGGDRDDFAGADVPIPDAEQTGTLPTGVSRGLDNIIGFNPVYLHDGFAAFDPADTVSMHVTAAVKPGVFTSEQRPGFAYLLMPVRLAG